jgi:uncharacterized protein (TIGR01370 family)
MDISTSLKKLFFMLMSYFSSGIPSAMLFYGSPVPLELLSRFDMVIVEPEYLADPTALSSSGSDVFAYISVGEINHSRSWHSDIPGSWLLGVNKDWSTSIVNLDEPGWQDHLLSKQMQPLWNAGYRGFFLDTLDSYQISTLNTALRKRQRKALIKIVQAMHERFPGVKIIVNRGFDLFPDIADLVVGVAAESLFKRWDASQSKYTDVPDEDRKWLSDQLSRLKSEHNLQVLVIDYLPYSRRDEARDIAKKISALGFIPIVTNYSMDMIGISSIEVWAK